MNDEAGVAGHPSSDGKGPGTSQKLSNSPGAHGDCSAVNSAQAEMAEKISAAQSLQPLRVLFAVDSYFPGFGGAEKQALKLAAALRQRGAYVEFVAPQIVDEQALDDMVDGFPVRRIDYPRIPKFGALVLMAKFRRYLLDNAHRFDCVHVHITHLLAAAAGFARSKSQLPVITKISGFYEFQGGVLDQKNRFNPVNFLIRQGLKHVDHVQTISVQTRQKLLAAGFRESQISFVPNGIDVTTEPKAPPAGKILKVGYCGRLREVKGVHVLLDGIARFKHARPQQGIELLVAGNGEARDDLEEQARSLGIAEHVHWLGRIEDTPAFFQSLDIYVQPSFAEGLPNSVMEAMLEQRPVVATDVGGNCDLIEDGVTGVLFPAGDAHALSEKIMLLVDKTDLSQSLAGAAREHIVRGYGFDHVVTQLAGLYSA